MSKSARLAARAASGCVEIKSKFDAEFRRFGLELKRQLPYEEFYNLVRRLHNLKEMAFTVWYTDPDGDLLPITNNENLARALATARPLLRVNIQRKGELLEIGYGTSQKRPKASRSHIAIGFPEDFRRVSAIIDVDILPESHRRVRLMKNGSDKPLGFYIRDGTSIRVTQQGLEKVPGVFISRLVPGGLAESTGLLAVNDEVLEVNGIEVVGKTLDQVTDMMVANSSNLIITVKPVNQHNNISPRRGGSGRSSQKSIASQRSGLSGGSVEVQELVPEEQDDEDEVEEHTSISGRGSASGGSGSSGSKTVVAPSGVEILNL